MKLYKAFSLAEILITISVIAIIAGISMSFFKRHEPDIKIYNSTVRQLGYAMSAIVHKACSDEFICQNGNQYQRPTCPNYNADIVTMENNQCLHVPDAVAGNCIDPAYNLNASINMCEAAPECNAAGFNRTTMRNIFCTNGGAIGPRLDTTVTIPDNRPLVPIGTTVNITFFCDQMFDMLTRTNGNELKANICTTNLPITLPNRARVYNLGFQGGMPLPPPAGTPGILVIQYNNPNNGLFAGAAANDSVADDTAGFVVVYPNGKIVSRETLLEANPNFSQIFTTANLQGLTGQNPNDTRQIILNNGINGVCGADGSNCANVINNGIFKQVDEEKTKNLNEIKE